MTYTVAELAAQGIEAHPTARVSRRVAFYGVERIRIGAHGRIDDGCILTGNILIGDRVHLAPYCVLYGKAGIVIGDYSGFGVGTAMHSESDDYTGESLFGPCVPAAFQPHKLRAPVVIGKHVLTGTRVTILPGVTMGDGVAVGAHGLVKSDCSPWRVFAGSPVRFVRERNSAAYLALLREFEASIVQ